MYDISIKESLSDTQRKFTLAHELAHYILHRQQLGSGIKENRFLRNLRFKSTLEVEANALAYDIILPFQLMDHAILEGHKTYKELASLFEVHENDIANRLQCGFPN